MVFVVEGIKLALLNGGGRYFAKVKACIEGVCIMSRQDLEPPQLAVFCSLVGDGSLTDQGTLQNLDQRE